MNTQPNRTSPVEPSSFYLRERYFWQSRAMLRDPPHLTDLHSLACQIRKSFRAKKPTYTNPDAAACRRGGIMQRNEYMEEISNKIRSGEPVGFLEAIAAINYQATLKAEREAAVAATLRGRIKRWLQRKADWLRGS